MNSVAAKNARWWRDVTAHQWLIFALTAGAWLFDTMEQRIFSLVRIPALSGLLGLPGGSLEVQGTAKVATAILLMGWGIGGLVSGTIGDRYGRARILTISITVYAICSLLTALVRTADQFIMMLFLSGVSFGGVFGLAVAIISETAPASARIAMLTLLQVLSTAGNILAAVLKLQVDSFAAVHLIAIADVWRTMFLIGAFPIILAFASAKWLKETDVWLRLKSERRLPRGPFSAYADIFRSPQDRRNLYFGAAISVAGVAGLWAIGEYAVDLQDAVFTTYYAATRSPETTKILTAQAKNWAYILQMLGAGLGMAAFGWAAQHFGRRKSFVLTFIAAFSVTSLAYGFLQSPRDAYWMMPLMSFFQFGLLGGFSVYLPELFGARYRGTGVSFCYNLGRFGAAGGSLISALMTTRVFAGLPSPLPLRYSAIVMCVIFLFGAVMSFFIPETKGTDLRD